jgi:hypothetical protein
MSSFQIAVQYHEPNLTRYAYCPPSPTPPPPTNLCLLQNAEGLCPNVNKIVKIQYSTKQSRKFLFSIYLVKNTTCDLGEHQHICRYRQTIAHSQEAMWNLHTAGLSNEGRREQSWGADGDGRLTRCHQVSFNVCAESCWRRLMLNSHGHFALLNIKNN